ncbi:MAG: radical SAM protein [Treponema sp.]|nr:radical SAM protein [Treponema sp.]
MLYFSIHTLGCKLNQLEGEAVAEAFQREGFPVIPWEEDPPSGSPRRLMLLNTCTVTSMAEQKARRLIRAALRKGALVLVTGCYAQLNAGELAALEAGTLGEISPGDISPDTPPGRLFIISGDRKSALLDLPRCLSGEGEEIAARIQDWLIGLSAEAGPAHPGPAVLPDAGLDRRFRFAPLEFSTHTRGFLKIQDGCDRHCTYCRVRLARGGSVSLSPEEALGRLRALEAAGYAEAVLTGVNISCYTFRNMDLGGLLDLLIGGTERIRLRLSSLEPDDIDDSLLRSLADGRLRPHFHLSVQSGSGRILERMGRSYGPEKVERAVSQLRRLRGDPFLACDIIVGFPGEGEDDFKETLELCERADFAWIHVFPYSPRPGTPAWKFKDRLPQRELSVRAARLAELARRGRRNYIGRWIGREVELVPETRAPARLSPDGAGDFCAATSENYLKLLVPRRLPAGDPNAVPRCRIREIPRHAGNDSGPISLGGFDALGEPCF